MFPVVYFDQRLGAAHSKRWSKSYKSLFLEEKAHFLGIKQSTSVLVQIKKNLFFAQICCKFLAFLRFFAAKTLKMSISTSVWSAQHPNAGRSIQHMANELIGVKTQKLHSPVVYFDQRLGAAHSKQWSK